MMVSCIVLLRLYFFIMPELIFDLYLFIFRILCLPRIKITILQFSLRMYVKHNSCSLLSIYLLLSTICF